jgi:TolB-like protein/DNA-binding winged helix-turn-helix (wHTH) protein/tetratricopeptide (TPR) repeat protein
MGVPRINLAETPDFDLGGLRVSPARRQVSKSGEFRELEPKVAQVLIALASASPAVVSRDNLVEQCWDGRIVGDDALNRCILALRHLAREYSPEPFAIETVPRVGYSLVAGPGESPARRKRARIGTKTVVFASFLALLLAGALVFSWFRYDRAEAAPTSIAVLPFRNLSAGDQYFAQGLSEEILDQLTSEPAFRVAGPASTAEMADETDPRKLGRSLGVDYLLEGNVRPGRDRLRISAALIRTSDGTRLWSQTFDRAPDDILEIQSAIGQAVADGLKLRLVHAAPIRAIDGQSYVLFLNARGLLRSQNPVAGKEAMRLLREVIKANPKFAPAWSGYAEALELDSETMDREGVIAVIPQARRAAAHALQLDPNLAGAHRAISALAGGDTPEAIAHDMRAAALDPRSADGLLALSNAQHVSGDFAQSLVSARRAHDADPLLAGPPRVVLNLIAELGDRRGAEAWVGQGFPGDPGLQSFAIARADYYAGDFSEAARRWSELAAGASQWSSPSGLSLQNVLLMLGLSKEPPSRPPRPFIGANRLMPVRIWMAEAPSSSEWQWRNRSSAAELVYRDENVIAAKLMLNEGRSRELASTYDSPIGLLGVRRGLTIGTCYLENAAIAAIALRSVGRGPEANAILDHANEAIQGAYRRGAVPLWLEQDAAGIWALQGKSEKAVGALDRALRRGSTHTNRTDLRRLEDEPAFRSLRGDPRYELVRSRYAAVLARERRETARTLNLKS